MACVLVVDDSPEIVSLIRTILTRAGHEVLEAHDGREGEKVAAQRLPDAVIIDMFMPEQDGLQTIRALRKQYPEIKIIGMSGGSTIKIDYLSAARAFGADITLSKPFRNEDLLNALNTLLAG